MIKKAPTKHVVHPLIEGRWSPRSFEEQPISGEQIRSIFEAARWAPSCRNEQPWRFVVASRRDHSKEFKKLLMALDESNQRWAVNAAILVVSFVKTDFEHDSAPNSHAWYDVGLATAQMTLQASQFGISVHQMAGINTEKIKEDFQVPDGYEVVVAMAMGFVGNPKKLPEDLEKRERAPRERRLQSEFVFGAKWGRGFVG